MPGYAVAAKYEYANVRNVYRAFARAQGVLMKDMDKAERRAAAIIKDRAVQIVPKETGRLRDSIRINGSQGDGSIWSDLRYAAYVHWGTEDTRAQPFLTQAAEETEVQWAAVFHALLEKAAAAAGAAA